MAETPNKVIPKKYDGIYWGAFREDRKEYFKKYLQSEMYLSTSSKSREKFYEFGCRPHYLKPIDWSNPIVDYFRYTLYIEDKWIHTNFHNIANRWYEAGIHNNVIFFDENCWNTISKSNIKDVFDKYFLVSSYEELQGKFNECSKHYEDILLLQQKWHELDLIEKKEVLMKIKRIVENGI
jgi:hypothetical protein